MKTVDLHNHTKYSYDGQNTPREVIENAISCGIDVIGISDHQFSIGKEIFCYIDDIEKLKEEYKGKITVLCGLEVGLRPSPNDFLPSASSRLDYCLFESLDSQKAMDLYEFLEWKRMVRCPVGLAHTDIFALSKRYKTDILKLMVRENIFWEINFSGNYNYYFDFISNTEKQKEVSKSGIVLSVGSDTHWIGDRNKKKLVQTTELVSKLGNKTIF